MEGEATPLDVVFVGSLAAARLARVGELKVNLHPRRTDSPRIEDLFDSEARAKDGRERGAGLLFCAGGLIKGRWKHDTHGLAGSPV